MAGTHRLLHISDTHLRAPGTRGVPADVDPAARLEAVLHAVAAQGPAPDLIIHTGDVADDGDRGAVERVHARLTAVAPTLAVPGNHDDPAAVRDVFGPAEGAVGPWRVVGIDTVVPGAVEGQSDALPAVVAAAAGPTILAMHHPIRSHSTHPWFRVAGGPAAERALDASPHPWLVPSGHTHETFEERLGTGGEVRLLGAPATFYALRHTADAWEAVAGGTGARLITLSDDGGVRIQVIAA